MSRAQEEERLRAWLRTRGWQDGYAGWTHPDFPETAVRTQWGVHGGIPMDRAFAIQQRRDREAATSAREVNIRDADLGMDDEWRRAALAAIRRVAERLPEFTTDQVLDEDPTLEQGREPRALGPCLLYAAKDGIIAPTDRYVSSSRKASNARAKRAWRSLVFGGHAPQPELTAGLGVLEAVGP